MSLTPKQEKFCQKYIELGNASQAYRLAYPSSQKWKENVVHSKASELLKNGKVLARVSELQEEHRERHDITVDSLTQMLIDDRQLAYQVGNPSAAVAAVNGIAKLHGLVIDKKSHTGKDGGPIQVEGNVITFNPVGN